MTLNQKTAFAVSMNVHEEIDARIRTLLVGHVRFFMRASRVLRSCQLADVEMPWIRLIEYQGAGMEITIVYSQLGGCVITINLEPGARINRFIETPERKHEPIRDRIAFWQSEVRKNIEDLDFRQRTILRALFHGFREPLRKGHRSKK